MKSYSSTLSPQEQEIMDHIGAAYMGILGLGLAANTNELAQATHTLQHFVMVRALNRIDPDYWSDWYSEDV